MHPGGPFWAKKDHGAWSIPKGEAGPGEDLLARARAELREETGLDAEGSFVRLAPVKQTGKWVHAWAIEGDADVASIVSNTFSIEYPPHSGRLRTFPEVDKAEWFDVATARDKIIKGQCALLDQLEQALDPR